MIAPIADQRASFPERLGGADERGTYALLGLPAASDGLRGGGPLLGFISCVARASHDLSFVTGHDVTLLDRPSILRLRQGTPAASGSGVTVRRCPGQAPAYP